MAFKIYYENAPFFKSWEHDRKDLSPHGVVAIIQDDRQVGWVILTGYDFYVWHNEWWIGANYFQLLDILIEKGMLNITRGISYLVTDGITTPIRSELRFKDYLDKTGFVLTGRMVPNLMQEDILQMAAYDTEFAMKSRWTINERPVPKLRAPGVSKHYAESWDL